MCVCVCIWLTHTHTWRYGGIVPSIIINHTKYIYVCVLSGRKMMNGKSNTTNIKCPISDLSSLQGTTVQVKYDIFAQGFSGENFLV